MIDKSKRWIENATAYEVDLGYAILADGSIITSDGEPRCVDDFQLRYIQELPENKGRDVQFRFRKPTEAEARAMSGQNDALARSFAEFKERQ